MIGLGAGMVPTLLSERAPEIATTSIEIDPEVVETARRFFRFAPGANGRVLVGDGRRELDRAGPGGRRRLRGRLFRGQPAVPSRHEGVLRALSRKLPPDGVLADELRRRPDGRAEPALLGCASRPSASSFRALRLLVRARRGRATVLVERDRHRDAIARPPRPGARSPTARAVLADQLGRPADQGLGERPLRGRAEDRRTCPSSRTPMRRPTRSSTSSR